MGHPTRTLPDMTEVQLGTELNRDRDLIPPGIGGDDGAGREVQRRDAGAAM